MPKYQLEFILHTQEGSAKTIKSALAEFSEIREIAECESQDLSGKDFRVSLNTEDPTVIFDLCAQFGRIRQVKVGDSP